MAKKVVFIHIVDGNDTDKLLVSRALLQHSDTYNFIIAPKKINLHDIDDIMLRLEKLKDDSDSS